MSDEPLHIFQGGLSTGVFLAKSDKHAPGVVRYVQHLRKLGRLLRDIGLVDALSAYIHT